MTTAPKHVKAVAINLGKVLAPRAKEWITNRDHTFSNSGTICYILLRVEDIISSFLFLKQASHSKQSSTNATTSYNLIVTIPFPTQVKSWL
jgi:hypothetical protein